jgi:hypothetical protein
MTPPAASAAAAAPAIHPRRTTGPRRAPATRRPRRVSGPANPARGRAGSTRPQARVWSGPLHAAEVAEAVATHRLLDRLIRGRVWIGVIAFALIGIVTMQLVLLKLNAGIGRSLVREALLQRENATLSAENSEAGAGEQIEAQAARDGMEQIPAKALSFLTSHAASDVGKAAAALSAAATTSSTGGSATSGTSTTAQTETGTEAGSGATSGTDGAGEATAAGATSAAGTAGASTESESATSTAGSTPEAGGQAGAGHEATAPASTGTSSNTATQDPESGASATTSAAGGAGETGSQSPGATTATGGGTGG